MLPPIDAWHRWVPAGWVEGRLSALPLDAALGVWSGNWLAFGDVRAGRWRYDAATGNGGTGWTTGEGLSLWLVGHADAALASLMFGEPPTPGVVSPDDRGVLHQAAQAGIVALREALATAVEGRAGAGWSSLKARPPGYAALLMSPDAGSIGMIVLDDDLARRRAMASLPQAPEPPPLEPLALALGRQRVQLSARVGGCALMLEELAGLARGDVLILDAALDSLAELAVNGVARGEQRCTITRNGSAIALTLT